MAEALGGGAEWLGRQGGGAPGKSGRKGRVGVASENGSRRQGWGAGQTGAGRLPRAGERSGAEWLGIIGRGAWQEREKGAGQSGWREQKAGQSHWADKGAGWSGESRRKVWGGVAGQTGRGAWQEQEKRAGRSGWCTRKQGGWREGGEGRIAGAGGRGPGGRGGEEVTGESRRREAGESWSRRRGGE